jgi:uncharacterized iron-regulated protein
MILIIACNRVGMSGKVIYASVHTRISLPATRALALAGMALLCAVHAQAQEHPAHPAAAGTCLAVAAWHVLDGAKPRATAEAELLAEMAKRDIVLLGEQHDDADHHQWQLQALAGLHLMRPQLVIGFESFPRRAQPVLDKWVAGELTVKQFLEQSEWEKVWNLPAELYLPLFHFARINRIPMMVLNVDRALTEAISKQGWDAVPADQKEGVSRPAAASEAYRDFLFEVFKQHPRLAPKGAAATSRSAPAFQFFVESQTTWDRAIAEALARRSNAATSAGRPLVVGIVGGAHVRHGYGVQHQLRDLGVSSVGTLLPADAKQDCSELGRGYADAVFALPETRREQPPPPRLGVRLEEADGGVRIADVTSGSLAEKTGLKRGDHIVSLAGSRVSRASSVVAAVRSQPAGTWLPMQVRRGADVLDFVVKFPPHR